MAKVKFSALISDMRNKLNGSVFSKNRGGSYLRNKVTPVNPQSTAQTLVRGFLSTLSQQWRALTEAQRLSFNSAVSNFSRTDIFGDIKNPSGINLFVRLGLNALNTGNVALTTAPAIGDTPDAPVFTTAPDSAPQTLSIASALAAVPVGEDWILRATANLSPGKNFVKSEYRQIGVIPSGTVLPYDALPDFTAKFGALVGGQKVGFEMVAISTTSFVNSQPARALEIVL